MEDLRSAEKPNAGNALKSSAAPAHTLKFRLDGLIWHLLVLKSGIVWAIEVDG
jgi:hypothetical protein